MWEKRVKISHKIIMDTLKKEFLGRGVCHIIRPKLYKYMVFFSLSLFLYISVIYLLQVFFFLSTFIYFILLLFPCLFYQIVLYYDFVKDFYLNIVFQTHTIHPPSCVWCHLSHKDNEHYKDNDQETHDLQIYSVDSGCEVHILLQSSILNHL